ARAERTRVALFDFDGTLSLIRSGWMDVMVPMMVELLRETNSGETDEQLRGVVEEFVGRLTGKQTMYQMIELAENIERRGGKPLGALEYKKMYLDRLWSTIEHRINELKRGECSPEKYLVPGSRALLESLRERGYKMYLASGTDDVYMQEEARLLDVHRYFDGVHGALDDYKSFSKAILIQRIISSAEFSGDEFLGFGDGYVEIENVKQVGGVAVGVATEEPDCKVIDQWKRERLVGVGADWIVPHFGDLPELNAALFQSAAVKP
ncbi:MAG TPA: HAD family hydrolase, partial [Bryobacteraceae bacterium]|nr:HAD family hydrolase [Bryobacteraceae bacterium]